MDIPNLTNGVWSLAEAEQPKAFAYLRFASGLSESEAMIPVPEAKVDAVALRASALLKEYAKGDPVLEGLLENVEQNAQALRAYFFPPTDSFLKQQEAVGQAYVSFGVPPIALSAVSVPRIEKAFATAIEELLPPDEAAKALPRIPAATSLMISLFLDAYFAGYQAKVAAAALQEEALVHFLKITGMSRELYSNMLASH